MRVSVFAIVLGLVFTSPTIAETVGEGYVWSSEILISYPTVIMITREMHEIPVDSCQNLARDLNNEISIGVAVCKTFSVDIPEPLPPTSSISDLCQVAYQEGMSASEYLSAPCL